MKKNNRYDFTKEEIEFIRNYRKPATQARDIEEYYIRSQKRMAEVDERQRYHEEIEMFRIELFNKFGPTIIKALAIIIGLAFVLGSAVVLDRAWFKSDLYELAYMFITTVTVVPVSYVGALIIIDKIKDELEKYYW